MPDHPHESVCYEVTDPVTLAGNYALAGQPPIKPRMFGIVSAYDGRLAQPYAGKTQRPGRIVCDSTWHHYVNINLDGTPSGRSGLGAGSGAGFVPSPDLEKIYAFYRNTLRWLQPANRVWCDLFWDLAAVRLHPSLFEELMERERIAGWGEWAGLGADARTLLTEAYGSGYVREQVTGVLQSDGATAALGDMLAAGAFAATALDADALIDGVLGGLLAQIAQILPSRLDAASAKAALEQGPARHLKVLQARMAEAAEQGVVHQMARIERSLKLARTINLRATH